MTMAEKRVLVIAPHPDDETLGVGGTLAKFCQHGGEAVVLTVSGHLPPLYPEGAYERTVDEAHRAHALIGVSESIFLEIPSTMLGDVPIPELNRLIQDVVTRVRPHVVFLPYPDRHIDHRLVFDSTLVATRPVRVGAEIEILAAYETLSETHWNAPHIEPNFTPNWIVDISDFIDLKKKALSCYESQISSFPGPRSLKAIEALATFRGTQAGFGYGEGFHIIRMCS
jgi:LmbE family N-acetylglucosaminyl deacetylase